MPEYDYTEPGAFFVTVNCFQKQKLFGKVVGEGVRLNKFGSLARECWQSIPDHFPSVTLDAFIVMPNHIHGVLFINETVIASMDVPVRAQHAAPPRQDMPRVLPGSLGAIIRSYKSAVTRSVNRLRASPGASVWHRNYYERVIRSQRELDSIRHYIVYNALKLPAFKEMYQRPPSVNASMKLTKSLQRGSELHNMWRER